jgi:hypothetical protein
MDRQVVQKLAHELTIDITLVTLFIATILIREEHVRQSDHYFGRLKLQFTSEGIERTLKKTIVTVIAISLPVITIIIIGSHFIIRYFLNKVLKTPNYSVGASI